MKVYDLTPEIVAVSKLVREMAESAGPNFPTEVAGVNALGWQIHPDTRVVLEPVEMAWALDLAFKEDA